MKKKTSAILLHVFEVFMILILNAHSFGFFLKNLMGTCKLRNGKKRKETKRNGKKKKRKENKEKSNEKKRKITKRKKTKTK